QSGTAGADYPGAGGDRRWGGSTERLGARDWGLGTRGAPLTPSTQHLIPEVTMATRTKEVPKKPAGDTTHNVGKVVQVIGPVLDVEFEPERLPEIYNAVVIDHKGNGAAIRLTAEVQQHIGRNQVRAVAMTSTDGVVRGM